MTKIALLLLCLGSVSHGRRVQSTAERFESLPVAADVNPLKKLLLSAFSTKESSTQIQHNITSQIGHNMSISEVVVPDQSARKQPADNSEHLERLGKSGHRWRDPDLLNKFKHVVVSDREPKYFLQFSIGLSLIASVFACFCIQQTHSLLKFDMPSKPHAARRQFKHRGRLIYEWDQDDSTVWVYIKPPRNIKKSSIEVRVWPRHIIVQKSGNPAFIKDELFASVDEKASTWSFSETGELQVCLRKVEQIQWPCVLSSQIPQDIRVR